MSKITTVSGDLSDTYYLQELKAIYTGPKLFYNSKVNRKDIKVLAIYNDGTIKNINNWILLEDIVTKNNEGTLDIKYNEWYTVINIPIQEKEIIKFECHYHGTPVLINTNFDKINLHARIIYNDMEFKELNPNEYNVSDTLVTNLGNSNFYTATYQNFTDDFVVYGYYNNLVKDKEFKIYSIIDNNLEEDITDIYYSIFFNEILNKIFISTTKLNSVLMPGKYRLILPKNTGLNCKYSSEWIVIKDFNNNLKITPIKYFHKEEENNNA